MDFSSVKHTIRLSTDEHSGCPFCGHSFGTCLDWDINHLLKEHDGLLVHVGSESINGADEPSYYSTVAIVGFSIAPPERTLSARFSPRMPPQS